jgi:hypothetical protein
VQVGNEDVVDVRHRDAHGEDVLDAAWAEVEEERHVRMGGDDRDSIALGFEFVNGFHDKAPQYARNFRNDMYLTSEAFRLMKKQAVPGFSPEDWKILDNYKKHIDLATKFIPGG